MTLQHATCNADTSHPGEPLGDAVIGLDKDLPAVAWPRQPLRAPLLLAHAPHLLERWWTEGPVQQGHSEGIHWRRSADLLYGVIELHEADFSATPQGAPLQHASQALYERVFRLLQAQGTPHLWRVWNYLARINEASHGLERYRQFNLGRYEAFVQARRETGGQVPAACAIGVAHGPLSVAFLAGTTPLVPLENPRQVSAWNYPARYGPRAPTFSRAALAYPRGQELLFVSGTASIVGHASQHADSLRAQLDETLTNLDSLLGAARAHAPSLPPHLDASSRLKIYVSDADDADAVAAQLEARLGTRVPWLMLHADVCRRELLVEIEGMHGVGA